MALRSDDYWERYKKLFEQLEGSPDYYQASVNLADLRIMLNAVQRQPAADSISLIMKGHEALREQTVRIRRAAGAVPGQPGDTEDIVANLYANNEYNRARWAQDLEIAGKPLDICPTNGQELAAHINALLSDLEADRNRLAEQNEKICALEGQVQALKDRLKAFRRREAKSSK